MTTLIDGFTTAGTFGPAVYECVRDGERIRHTLRYARINAETWDRIREPMPCRGQTGCQGTACPARAAIAERIAP